MIKVAITGNIASGKSEVEKIVKKLGYKVLCTDNVAHDLLENNPAVRSFVYGLFKTNNRRELGEIIFSHPELKKKLEDIVHPLIKKELEAFFEKNKDEKLVFSCIPLLYEVEWEGLFDKVILVGANDNVRLKRIIKRNNFTREHAQKRIDSQMPQQKKERLADFIIKNEGSLKDLRTNVESIIEALKLL